MEQVEVETKANYGRFKGMSWFSKIRGQNILVVGNGGIGSWLSVLLARTGANLYLYDGDIIEAHNQSGQLYRGRDIGSLKVNALNSIVKEFCDQNIDVEVFPEMYNSFSASNPIVMTGLDNMKARRIVFDNWMRYLKDNPKQVGEAILIDGRLNAEQLQIFCIKGIDTDFQKEYEKIHLFEDSEAEEQDCTMKQTSHCGALIASLMTGFLTNFFGEEFREVPRFHQYSIPINLTTNEY